MDNIPSTSPRLCFSKKIPIADTENSGFSITSPFNNHQDDLFNCLGLASHKESLQLIHERMSALRDPAPPPSAAHVARARFDRGKSIDEKLFDATAEAKILTSQVSMHIDKAWRNRLFQQIDSLHDPEEWDPEDRPVTKLSFTTFLKAICQMKPTVRPGLGLSNAGHLLAAWTSGKDRLTIEFMENDRTRWVISRYIDNELEQFAGETQVSRLSDTLEPYSPQQWFSAC